MTDDQRPERPEEIENVLKNLENTRQDAETNALLQSVDARGLTEETDAIVRQGHRFEKALPDYTYEGSKMPSWEGDVIPTQRDAGPKMGQSLMLCGVVGVLALMILAGLAGCGLLVLGALVAGVDTTPTPLPAPTMTSLPATLPTFTPTLDVSPTVTRTPPPPQTLPPTWTPTHTQTPDANATRVLLTATSEKEAPNAP